MCKSWLLIINNKERKKKKRKKGLHGYSKRLREELDMFSNWERESLEGEICACSYIGKNEVPTGGKVIED